MSPPPVQAEQQVKVAPPQTKQRPRRSGRQRRRSRSASNKRSSEPTTATLDDDCTGGGEPAMEIPARVEAELSAKTINQIGGGGGGEERLEKGEQETRGLAISPRRPHDNDDDDDDDDAESESLLHSGDRTDANHERDLNRDDDENQTRANLNPSHSGTQASVIIDKQSESWQHEQNVDRAAAPTDQAPLLPVNQRPSTSNHLRQLPPAPATASKQFRQSKAPPRGTKNPIKLQAMSILERKWSQCSGSHASSSLAASSALGSSRRSSSSLDQAHQLVAIQHVLSMPHQLGSRACDRFNSDSALGRESVLPPVVVSSGAGGEFVASIERETFGDRKLSASGRTISQSMLELDESVANCREFEVYWRRLSFAYERPWLARTASKLAPRLGLAEPLGLAGHPAKSSRPHSNLVLRDLSGSFRSNQLVAIIGPSGCGKTTLLQFLAGNNSSQRERMRIRGLVEPKVAYIGQDDTLMAGLTARETLMYASRLQNNREHFDHAAHIQPILSELGLSECADRNVSKLSGGQAKRVIIAQELLYPTNILILDEVTSGLDASTSYSIVRLLKYLVSDRSYPMSIVMSIHQPSARLFAVFDRVYVMSEGQCLYEGSCEPTHINAHLARFQLECPKYHNMADYLIELACCCSQSGLELDEEQVAAGAQDMSGLIAPAQVKLAAAAGHAPTGPGTKERMIEFQRAQSSGEFVCTSTGGVQANYHQNLGQNFEKSHQQKASPEMAHEESHLSPANEIPYLAPVPGANERPTGNHQLMLDDCEEDSSLYLAIERSRQLRAKPFLEHLRIHFKRSLVRIRRSYILTYLQLITYIVLGLQLSTFYGPDIGQLSGCPRLPTNLMSYILTSGSSSSGNGTSSANDDPGDELTLEIRRIQENMNFLLVTVMTATFAALEITVITFPLEAKTIKREWRNGWYRVSSYFMGRTLADLPFQLAFVLIFCLLIYVMTGQIGLDTWRFPAFVATITMTALVAQSIGFIFGAVFMDNLPAAVFTAPLAIFPALLFSGFFSRVSQIPTFYKPMTYLSHFRYAFDALLVTLYGFDRCSCDQDVLTQYHSSMRNQTSSMREMFGLLFGASDCMQASAATATPEVTTLQAGQVSTTTTTTTSDPIDFANAISHEDLAAIKASNSSLATQMIQSMTTTMSPLEVQPPGGVHHSALKPLEDALVETAFEQMAQQQQQGWSNSTDGSGLDGSGEDLSLMERLADKFSGRLSGMLNKQANFGHPMPRECSKFNSYLMTEFDLRNSDLIFGLSMLLVAVLLTRLLCNCILNVTIARRAR